MKNYIKKIAFATLMVVGLFTFTGCTEADTASRNLSNEADNFGVERRIIFFNGITDTVLLEIVGLCSLGNYDDAGELSVTCKTGNKKYKKHYLGLSDNVSYFVEQLRPASVSGFRYIVRIRPSVLIPNPELATKGNQNVPEDLTKPDEVKRGGSLPGVAP